MKTPKISVVIPVYNGAKFLKDAINSVLNQSHPVYEIIIVDDGSEDSPEDIINNFNNENIKLYKQKNSGPAKARNGGIISASGEYIAFLDADDIMEKEKLKEQVVSLQSHPEAALIYCGKSWINELGIPIEPVWAQHEFPEGWIFDKLFEANYISSSSCVVARKDAILEVGGFNEAPVFRNAEDYELWLRISARFSFLSLPKPLVRYRWHRNNSVRNVGSGIRGSLAALNSAANLISHNKVDLRNCPGQIDVCERMKRAYEDAAVSLFSADKYLALRSIGCEAIRKGYYSPGLLLRWCLCLLPDKITLKISQLKKKITKHS